jgi:hypothetical protein
MIEMQTVNHILAKEGILTAFSLAKRVTPLEINRLRKKFKDSNLNSGQFQHALVKSIIEATQKAFESEEIPGLMMKEIAEENSEKKRIMELTYFASIIAKKITDNNTSKYHSCFIINTLVNMLGLNEEDFDNFHKKFSRFREEKLDDSPEEE